MSTANRPVGGTPQGEQDAGPGARPRRARVSRAQARRRIGAAAERLLERHRFPELTVDLLMSEAGLSRTVFYRHFTELSQVVLELLDELGVDVLGPGGDAATGPDLGEAAALRTALGRTVAFFADHVRLLVALEDAARTDPGVAGAHREFVDRTVERLARAVPDPDPVRARETARALVALNTGYLVDAFTRSPATAREVAEQTLWTVWARTLRISPGDG